MDKDKRRTGELFVVAAPSGAGKTSLVQALAEADPGLEVSVSYTTRPPRPLELDGDAYHFVTAERFRAMVADDAFLEHARVFDHRYGTGKDWVREKLATGVDIILEIDWQGARKVFARHPRSVGIFLFPPSLETLGERLRKRGENEETVARRMREAHREIAHCHEFPYHIVNEDFERSLAALRAVIAAVRERKSPDIGRLDDFAGGLLQKAPRSVQCPPVPSTGADHGPLDR